MTLVSIGSRPSGKGWQSGFMFKNSRLNRYSIEKNIECFLLNIEATKSVQLLRHNRKTINRYYGTFRHLVHEYQKQQMNQFIRLVEFEESFVGPTYIRGRSEPHMRLFRQNLYRGLFAVEWTRRVLC
jgi:hypothetical protein